MYIYIYMYIERERETERDRCTQRAKCPRNQTYDYTTCGVTRSASVCEAPMR